MFIKPYSVYKFFPKANALILDDNVPKVERKGKHKAVRRFDFRYQIIEGIFLDAGFPLPAGVAVQTAFDLVFEQRDCIYSVAGDLGTPDKVMHELGGVAIGATTTLYDLHLFTHEISTNCLDPKQNLWR